MIQTIEQAKDVGYNTYQYGSGWFSYDDDYWIEHLIIDWIEVASALWVFKYAHDVWETRDTSWWAYTLFYKWEKVCEWCCFHSTRDEYIYRVGYTNGDERIIDVTDRITWF
jgi:hypothetical protein